MTDHIPAEVRGALWPLEPGGNWEGGTTDRQGRRWVHSPHEGWSLSRHQQHPVFVTPRRERKVGWLRRWFRSWR